tara:strand:+ start:2405 stop:3106 length:702 start_codon:yes stop_codon:yes gene_type:complete
MARHPTAPGGGVSGMTAGYVTFPTSATALSGDSTFRWDNTLKYLGIGGAPVASGGKLQIHDGTAEAVGYSASLLSVQVNGTASLACRHTGNNVESVLAAGSGSGFVGTYSSHVFEFMQNGSLRSGIDSTGFYHSNRNKEKKGADVAAVAALTLGSDGNVFVTTGTTAITSVVTTNWQSGSTIKIKIASGGTLTNGATLALAGAANITGGANGTWVQLTLSGTVWEQTAAKVDL